MAAALFITAVFLALFGAAFVALGVVNDRSYWSQRDPSAVPGSEGVGAGDLVRHAWEYALRGRRPSLRVGGVGVLLIGLAAVFAVLGGISLLFA